MLYSRLGGRSDGRCRLFYDLVAVDTITPVFKYAQAHFRNEQAEKSVLCDGKRQSLFRLFRVASNEVRHIVIVAFVCVLAFAIILEDNGIHDHLQSLAYLRIARRRFAHFDTAGIVMQVVARAESVKFSLVEFQGKSGAQAKQLVQTRGRVLPCGRKRTSAETLGKLTEFEQVELTLFSAISYAITRLLSASRFSR